MTKNLFHIVLMKPEIPHNTGAIGRLCVGLGCPLHLIRPLGFHLSDEYVRRAGLDYWEFLDLSVHSNWEEFLAEVKPCNIHFLSTKGEKSLYQCSFQEGDALIFGSESKGLPPEMYRQHAEQLFRIPMPGEHGRSINLANAVSIAAYEAYRQLKCEARGVK
jgi:tRNA (cytidine/uridine-2'-O-)-methyltransferase